MLAHSAPTPGPGLHAYISGNASTPATTRLHTATSLEDNTQAWRRARPYDTMSTNESVPKQWASALVYQRSCAAEWHTAI
ncbi:hypothetical protein GCM10017559_80820 [Streptosporangium longisporum]|uniref:Uncharacterized protein n=1 Tax=Streptosporangium longisporum TaxID=46187 RepID=A0ABP6LG11_9ACTN